MEARKGRWALVEREDRSELIWATHKSLKSLAVVHREYQNHMPAGLEGVNENVCILLLGGPDAVLHGLFYIVVVPRFDQEITHSCRDSIIGI